MKKMFVSLHLLVAVLMISGCNRNGLDSNIWKFSGSDAKRGIDHYYSKPSVKKIGEGVFTVTTKAIPTKGKKAVEEATRVKNAYAVATTSTLTIPSQSFPSEGITVWGSGNLSGNKINWVYYVNDGANQDTIISTYTKL